MAKSDSEFLEAGMRFVLASTNLKVTLTNLVRSAVNAVGSNCGSVYLLDKTGTRLEPYILINFPPEYLEGCSTVELGHQCCGRAALHKIPWAVQDMWTDPLFIECREAAKKSGMRSGFSVPILNAREECLGTLGAQFHEPYLPSLYDLERHRLFAQLISFAISRQQADDQKSLPYQCPLPEKKTIASVDRERRDSSGVSAD